MRSRTPLTRRVIAALLMVLLTACHTWQPITASPQGWTPEERPSSVRATLANGRVITVEDPMMRNDSIVGATDFAGVVGVAPEDISLLEERRLSILRSIGLGYLILGTVQGLALIGGP